jgi:GT2 family glycosyltransferase
MPTVVIPTYGRPGPLIDCIRSLIEGKQQPCEIIVVGREGDASTKDALVLAQQLCAGRTALRTAWVTEAGHIPPVEKGLALASSPIVAVVDDDVTVTPEWLGHLSAAFEDPSVGVAGGRVLTEGAQPPRCKGKPGCNSWYGKHWGNVTSLNGDRPIEVQGVAEGNWAWRRDLLASLKFDNVLNFDDASMYGLDLCLQAQARGSRVIYEPRAVVFHHPAPRPRGLERADRPRRNFSYARNYTYIMLKHLPWWRRPIFLAWWFLIGERGAWGLAALLVDALTGRVPRLPDIWGTVTGKFEGLRLATSGVRSHG